MDNLLHILMMLINFNTTSPANDESFLFLKPILEKMGFVCELHHADDMKVSNMIATLTLNDSGKILAYSGHLDIVPINIDSKYDQLKMTIDDQDNVYGRGTVDMKGSIAAFIVAVDEYLKSDIVKNQQNIGKIIFLLSGDEETNSFGIKKILPLLPKNIDTCIVGEPTSDNQVGDNIKVGRRGSINIKLKINGIGGHIAYPQFTSNPIFILAKIITDLKALEIDKGTAYFQPTNLEISNITTSNTKDINNIIPEEATASINIRYNILQTSEKLLKIIEDTVKQYTNSYEITYKISGDPFLTNMSSNAVTTMVDCIYNIAKIKPKITTDGGTSEARFLYKYVDNIFEIGLLNKTAHKNNEHTTINDLNTLKDIYLEYLKKY